MPPKPTNAFGQQLPLSEDQDYLGKAIQGFLGAIGLGDDGGSTTTPSPLQRSNRGGQLVGSVPGEVLKGLGATKAIPGLAVTAVPPEYLAKLRYRGTQLMQKLLASGALEERSIGMNIKKKPGLVQRITGATPELATVDAHPELLDALNYARQRYPRLFAHNMDITDIDAFTKLTGAGTTIGSSGKATIPNVVNDNSRLREPKIPGIGATPFSNIPPTDIPVLPHKKENLSNLSFNPPAMRNQASGPYQDLRPGQYQYPQGRPAADVVGHEMLHSADRLTWGNDYLNDLYEYSNKTFGYNNNAQEIRARLQGGEFNRQYQEWVKAGRPQTKYKLSKSNPKR